MSEAVRRRLEPDALLTGLVLVGAGIAFLTGEFGEVVRHWWPMLVVLVGIPKLLQRRTIWSGLWLITVGVWLQLIQLHLFGLRYANGWPLLLIVVGAGMALRAVFDVREETRDER